MKRDSFPAKGNRFDSRKLMSWRRLAITSLAVLMASPCALYAQSARPDYPARAVKVVVGFAAGGAADGVARALNQVVQKELGQAFIVDNRAGAAGSVAIQQLTREAADGYTLGVLLQGAVINQYIRPVDYDVTIDLTPILMFGTAPPGIVVKSDAAWKTLEQLLAYARQKPEGIRYATAGIGSAQHLAMEILGKRQGIKWIHVPYRSGAAAAMASLSGEVEVLVQTPEWLPMVKDGKLRLLATMGKDRMPELPSVPTLQEAGIDVAPPTFLSIVGPKGLPAAVAQRLTDAYSRAMSDPGVIASMTSYGVRPVRLVGDDFRSYLNETAKFYAGAVASLGVAELTAKP